MANIIDYAHWRGDLSFNRDPVNPVDLLLFAQIVHAPLESVSPEEMGLPLSRLSRSVYPVPPARNENTLIRSRYELWSAFEGGARFGGVRLLDFVSELDFAAEKQFAAAAFQAGPTRVVSFRGTDSTLIGWKEDFNMGFSPVVPSQESAAAFLEKAAEGADEICVTGHSKGGNLAMYAASACSPAVQSRIRCVYSFDGPGLNASVLESDGWRKIESRVHSLIPESSVIGLLLGYRENYTVVESDSVSLMQHNPYFWHVLGREFVAASDTTFSSRFMNRTLHAFVADCTPEQRRVLIDTLFGILSVSGATKMSEVPRGIARHWDEVSATLRAVPPEDRAVVSQVLKILAESGGESAKALLLRRFRRSPADAE